MSGVAEAKELFLDAPTNASAAARSQMYALLAEAFAYPNESVVRRLLGGSLLAEIQAVAATLPTPVDVPTGVILPVGTDARDRIQVIYTRLFEIGGGRRTISLLERRYTERKNPEQELWEDLLRFYGFWPRSFRSRARREPRSFAD